MDAATRIGAPPNSTYGLRSAAAFVLAASVLLTAVPQAFGHAAFLGSDPAPGVRLAVAPERITMTFTEPLNRRLADAELRRVGGGRVAARVQATSARRIVVVPVAELGQGAYRIRWHSVSTQDGHALEGTFSFGVRAAAVGGGHVLEQSPFARNGWARVVARILLYATLLLFAGALLLRVLLPRGDGTWLTGAREEASDGVDLAAAQRRERTITNEIGVAAASATILAALLEAADAARGFSPQGMSEYLLTNVAGAGRVAVIACVLLALVLWQRRVGLAATFATLALGAVAASGHAGSASPRLPSILNDWGHLVSGAIWLGGVALIALVWVPCVRRDRAGARRRISRDVLPRFGRVALPAFVAVISTGAVSLLLQLGEISDLWGTAYGRVLAAKIVLVAVIAGLSWRHARRVAAQSRDASTPAHSRWHWGSLRAQPLLGLGVVAAVALLATFPLPPRQLADADATVALPVCDPCPLPRPAADELGVADGAGRYLVAGWLRRDGKRVTGTIRLFDYRGRPAAVAFHVRGDRQSACGPGCKRFSSIGEAVVVSLVDRGRRYSVRLPARWQEAGSRRARGLLVRAQQRMRALRSLRQVETITSGPGTFARTRFRLRAPNRLAYSTDRDIKSVVIGKSRWLRAPDLPWQRGSPVSGLGFSTRSWFRWTAFAQEVRLLRTWRRDGRRLAELALMDPGTPVWLRLTIDLDGPRVLSERQTSPGRFLENKYSRFDQPVVINPPSPR